MSQQDQELLSDASGKPRRSDQHLSQSLASSTTGPGNNVDEDETRTAYTPDNLQQMTTVTVGREGALVLPPKLRRQLSLTEGTRALIYLEDGRIILKPVRPGEHRLARGMLKGKGMLKALMETRKMEREL